MHQDVIEGFRLSPQQEHIWQFQQSDPSFPSITQCAVMIEGALDVQTLQASIQQVVDQHEILRTTFHCLAGMTLPLQVIQDSSPVVLDIQPLDDPAQADLHAAMERLLESDARPPFDLKQGPVLRLSLHRVSPQQHILVISLPALCADDATLEILVRQISLAYSGGPTDESADAPMQYADFAEWQHELIESEDTAAGRMYWRKQNLANLAGLRLPFDLPSRPDAGYTPLALTTPIAPALAAQIDALVQRADSSRAAFFLGCWQVLLGRLTGQSELIVGTAYDGRKYQELKEMPGVCVHYLPLTAQLDEQSFSQVLAQAELALQDGQRWQESFSWEELADANNATPLLRTCFELAQQPLRATAGDLSFAIGPRQAWIERCDLKLVVQDSAAGPSTTLLVNSLLFSVQDTEQLAEHLHALLASAADQPETPISRLPIMSLAQQRMVLEQFNASAMDAPAPVCIHELFQNQAQRTPTSVAIAHTDQQLTYAELNSRANQLAHHLQTLGVGPGTRVALCIERSIELVVGLLGILKAGGCYVPLDPAYPQERLQFMLQDVQASVLVTRAGLLPLLPTAELACIQLDDDAALLGASSQDNPVVAVPPEQLAYIIYTSGSTGTPKGVMVSHLNLLHSIHARLRAYPEPLTSFLVLSSFAFDSSVAGIFWSLCQGGRLVLPREDDLADLTALTRLIAEQHVSHMLSLPSLYSQLLAQAQAERLASLRVSIVAGEACPSELVQQHSTLLPATTLYNEYGPTEATVWSSVYRCDPGDARPSVPLGRPIPNTQIYILDESLAPMPVGVPGELYIGGAGLAWGYHNRPALTAERFISSPFGSRPGARLYKTGDLGRYTSDGLIEFLGRTDQQIKIRGYRIELGEIEAVLGQYPGMREVAVVAREDSPGDKRLVTYVVVEEQAAPSSDDFREFLGKKLPDYMVPAIFVTLPALPTLPNGKIDRGALPAPDSARPSLRAAYVAPRTPIEETVATIWAELLKLERIGADDNFFDLGGHSLLATQMFSRLHHIFQVDLPVRSVFEKPTVAGIAEIIVERQIQATDQEELEHLLREVEHVSADAALAELRSTGSSDQGSVR